VSQFGSFNSLYGYYGRFQRARSDFGGLPTWARFVLLLTALPGILLGVLSILLIVVSIAALLLLTVPAYSLLRRLTRAGPAGAEALERPEAGTVVVEPADPGGFGQPGRRRVEATVVEPPERRKEQP
jgi:hypothetical protein